MNEHNENNIFGSEDNSSHRAENEPNDSAYSDASYTQAPGNGQQNYYGYNPSYSYGSPQAAKTPKQEKRPRRRVSVGAVLAICLAFVILAGAAGFGGAYLLYAGTDSDTALGQSSAGQTEDETSSKNGSSSGSGTSSSPSLTVQSTADANALTPEQIYTLACQQVVGISSEITGYNVFRQATSASVSGSGLIISEDGYILTNYHVIEDAYEGGYDIVVLTYDGTEYPAEVVGGDEDSDVAILKVDAEGLNAATLGDSNEMVVGETIYAVGNPLGELSYTMTSGIVSALDRAITVDSSTNVTINMFQIDAAVNSGNSGGPVYNQYGQVIGLVSAKYTSTGVEGLGFAIPIGDATYIANELLENGYVSGRADMGINGTTVSASVAQYYNMVEGAFINSVISGGAAEKAGLKAGDVVTAMDGNKITSYSDLTTAVKDYHAGESAEITIYRDGSYQTLTIAFDEEQPQTETQNQDSGGNDLQDYFNYYSNFGPGSGY